MSKQIDENDALGKDAVEILFVWGKNLLTTEADSYFGPKPKEETDTKAETALEIETKKNDKLIFYVNRVTSVQRLCIPPKAAAKVIAIAYGDGHPGFNKCYETIVKLWYVRGLVKQLRLYIKHCP